MMLYLLHRSGGSHSAVHRCALQGSSLRSTGLECLDQRRRTRELLTLFGNRLVEEKCVELKKLLDCVKGYNCVDNKVHSIKNLFLVK